MASLAKHTKEALFTSFTFSRSSFGLLPWGANLLASTFSDVDLWYGRPMSETHYTTHTQRYVTHQSINSCTHTSQHINKGKCIFILTTE